MGYKEKIIDMVGEIEDLRFLRAIYISLREFIEETHTEEKSE